VDQLQLPTLQRARDSDAADLLPKRTRLFIPHQEILVVDACQMKR
jgi:hypothetical protein